MNILCYSERKKWQIHYKLTNKWKQKFCGIFVNSETLVLNSDNSTEKKNPSFATVKKSSNTKWYFT